MFLRTGARSLALALVLAVVGAACGGSGGGSGGGDGIGLDDDPLAAPNESPGDRAVQITGANRVRLFGTFSIPPAASAASVPGALIIPSAGDGTRDGSIGVGGVPDTWALDLATALSNAGVASYRYDRRGTAESKIEPEVRLTVDDLVADAKAGVDLLAERRETMGKDISVISYDSGGLLALRLAASDERIKRVVLIATPGATLADAHAAQLSAVNGPASGEAVRATVASLIANRTLPPLNELRSELRPLFPAAEAAFLADLYSIDPTLDAARIKIPVLIVVPAADRAPYAPERLAAAVPNGAAQVTTTAGGPTMSIAGRPLPVNPNDPALHSSSMAGPVSPDVRDASAVGAITGFLSAATPR